MSRIKSKHTQPEIIVRKALTSLGFRYRLHVSALPGTPDLVIKKSTTVIFINGCFWHQHAGCIRSSIPKSNIDYWKPKLKKNIRNQKIHIEKLVNMGWKIAIVWECQTKKPDLLGKEIGNILEKFFINNR